MPPRSSAAPESRRKGPEATDARTEIVSELHRIFAESPTLGKCYLARTGLEDGRPLMLREVADRAERVGFSRRVTNERIRQVTVLAAEHLRAHSGSCEWPRFRAAAAAAHSGSPLTIGQFVAAFGYRDSEHPKSVFKALRRFADTCRLPFDFRTKQAGSHGMWVGSGEAEGAFSRLRQLNSVVGNLFGELGPVAAVLGCRDDALARTIAASPRWEFLDEEGRYFWKRPLRLPPLNDRAPTGNKVLTVLCVVFSGVKEAATADLAKSVVRHRSLRNRSVPVAVIESIAARSGLFEVADGRIRRGAGWGGQPVGGRDRLLLGIAERRGRAVSSRVLRTELVRGGLSQTNAMITIVHTPFLVHVKSGNPQEEGRYEFVAEPRNIAPGPPDRAAGSPVSAAGRS